MTMNKPAWTPGPWRVETGNTGAFNVWVKMKGYSAGSASICSRSPWENRPDESKANAALIAASPSLAEYVQRRADEGDEEAKRLMGTIHAAR